MNPPLNAATAVSFGIFGRPDLTAVLTFVLDVVGPVSFKAGGRSDLPVAACILARASGVRKENTDFPGRGVSPRMAPLSLGASWVSVDGPGGGAPRMGG